MTITPSFTAVKRVIAPGRDTTDQGRADTVHELYPTAIVASDDVVFGMARTYSILMEDSAAPVGVFRDRASAGSWLDVHG